MPKKTTILIVILTLITGLLIFLAVRSDQTQKFVNDTLNQNPSPTQITPYASLAFSQNPLVLPTGTTNGSVDIVIDTGGKPVAGAQIELTYNPNFFSSISLDAPQSPFFGKGQTVLINRIDSEQGRISFAAGISPTDEEKTGKGTVVTLNFTINPQAGATTQFAFLPKSAITTFSTPASVMKTPEPFTLRIGN